jgi:hypothetical protein
LFRANADGNNGKGFNFVMTALYHSDNHRKILAVGPSMYFDGGDGSFGAGYGTEPTGNSSVAIGLFTKSSASGAAAFGAYANASGQYSVALGNGAFATGYGATALGISSKASGDFSIAIGYDCETLNDYAIAMGYNTQASGQSSTSMGYSTQATGSYSSSAGIGTLARGFAGTVVGMYNFPVTASQTSVSSSTPLFIVGNGDDASNRSNALLVAKNGNVGIGSDLPSEQLVINGSGASTIQLQNNYIDKGFVQLSGNNLRVGTYSSNSTGNFIVRTNGSDQLTIFPSGNATLAGTLTQNSDARFKQNIEPLTGSLEKLLHLNGYQYYWKTGLKKDEKKQIGLIAQNVESVYPELVNTNAEGMKSVAYQNLVPVLIEAIKEQQIQINKLTTTIDQLLKNK